LEEVTLSGEVPSSPNPQFVVSTSAGGAVPAAEDRWLVIDDAQSAEVWMSSSDQLPPVAVVLWGAGGPRPTDITTAMGSNASRRYTSRWRSVEIAEGTAVSLVQFLSLQGDRSRAAASAERLSALPPEALAGLGVEEAARILNFQVLPDLSSA